MSKKHDPVVSWRDYVTLQITAERRVLKARLKAYDRAHRVQAMDLARRLEELNHAHEKAVLDRQELVSRNVFDPFRDQVKDELSQRKGMDRTAMAVVAAIVSVVIGIILLLGQRLIMHGAP